MNKSYTTIDIANMSAGYELDRIIHKLIDRGEIHHWLHVPEYSTDHFELIMLMSRLKDEGVYFTTKTTSEGFKTEYNGAVCQSHCFCESVCKVYVIGSI